MKRVLVVEDNDRWAEIMSRYVAMSGVDCLVSPTASRAIDDIDRWKPDVIVLDILLAEVTGVALLNEIRSHGDLAKIPIIICSSLEIKNEDLLAYGVESVLHKETMTPDQFKQSLREVLV